MNILIKQKEQIATKRLVLKPYSNKDIDSLVELLTNEIITKTFMVPDYETKEQFVDLAKKLISFSKPEDTKHLEYGIYLENKLIGFINDCNLEEDEIEIGYVVHPDYQGHGYATEAVLAVINDLKAMGFKKVSAGFLVDNAASRKVLEKCGMTPSDVADEVEYRGVLHKCAYYEKKI